MIGRLWSSLRGLLPVSLGGAAPAEEQPFPGDQLSARVGAELSGQVEALIGPFDPHRVTMERMLQMRNDPVLAFGTAMVRAPIINLNWRIDSDDEKIKGYVTAALRPHMRSILKALSNALPFGYKLLEKVWKAGPFSYRLEGKDGAGQHITEPLAWTFERFKPISHRGLTLLADEVSGEFLGARQSGAGAKDRTASPIQLVLWSFRDEDVDGDLRGYPLYHQAYAAWYSKQHNKLSRDLYLEKDADPLPIGRAAVDAVRDEKNIQRDGYSHMRRILRARRAGADVILPNTVDEKSGKYKWNIEYLENSGKAADIYQVAIAEDNTEMLEALGITDEVGTSQEMGGRARSETHADTFAETLQGYVDEGVDEVINPQIVDDLVVLRFGRKALEESHTRLVSGGISGKVRDALKEVLKWRLDAESMREQGGTVPLWKRIDAEGICKALDVPLLPEDEVEPEPEPEEPKESEGGLTEEQLKKAEKELARIGAGEE